MATFSMTCSCGQVFSGEGATRDEAVKDLQSIMDQTAITAHFQEMHPGEQAPSVAQVHEQIARNLAAAT
ncbi:MAG: hypothetical protein AAB605_03105 [Patescibacteria group bacterium]